MLQSVGPIHLWPILDCFDSMNNAAQITIAAYLPCSPFFAWSAICGESVNLESEINDSPVQLTFNMLSLMGARLKLGLTAYAPQWLLVMRSRLSPQMAELCKEGKHAK